MKKSWMFFLLIVILAIFTSPVLAQKQYTLKLLAVQENLNGSLSGSGADLYLELKEGTGRVFLDTYPVPKIDTQISTRFAKEIACHQYQLPCQNYDFIYTIKAQSSIIGGPSAGAAIAALTTIAVLDLDYDKENIAITGTVNSGGIIGPVGGTKEKLEAASQLGLKKVLIAKGTADSFSSPENDSSNITVSFNLTEYAQENLGLQLVEVSDLDEIILHLTGKKLNHQEVQIEENQQYTNIMSDLREILCSRVDKLKKELDKENIIIDENVSKRVEEQKMKAENATLQKDYYSAASYCFGASISLRTHYYQQQKPTLSMLWEKFLALEDKVDRLEENLSQQQIETIADLQTLIIVKERLNDVKEQISAFKALPAEKRKGDDIYAMLSYSEERYFSAVAWMKFFSMRGKIMLLDKAHIQQSCLQKILEAEERYQYVSLFIDQSNIDALAKKISSAKEASQKNEFELCLMKAIQAKGDANAVLSTLGLRKEELSSMLQSKIVAVKRVIAENTAEETFPILGYSYLQYASSLKDEDPVTALFYLEYALEMSDLSIYFPEEKTLFELVPERIPVTKEMLWGFAVGVVLTLVVLYLLPKRKKGRKKKYLDF